MCNQLLLCNCRLKEECPMDGKCQTIDAVYDCLVTSPEPPKIYFRSAERKWKKRYYDHKKLFNHKWYSHKTTLSSCVRHLKDTLDVRRQPKSSLVTCATPYTNISKKSLLCLYEKWLLAIQDSKNFQINERSYFANAVMRISTFWKLLKIMAKGNQIFSLKEKF